jgi:hypothetical protein
MWILLAFVFGVGIGSILKWGTWPRYRRQYTKVDTPSASHNSAMDEICGECGSLIKKHWKYCQECKSAITAVGRKHRQ